MYLQAERAVLDIVCKVVAAQACTSPQRVTIKYPPPLTQHPIGDGTKLTPGGGKSVFGITSLCKQKELSKTNEK